jgi:hypothetical protein
MLATQKGCPHCQSSAQDDGASCGCGGSHSHTIHLHDHDHEHNHDEPQDMVKLFDSLSEQTSMIRDIQVQIMRKALTYLAALLIGLIVVVGGIVWLTKSLGWW